MVNKKDKNRNKVKTKALHKFLLVLFSIILTLFFLEIFLRVASLFYISRNIKSNKKTVTSNLGMNTYTILCIGESTTFGDPEPVMKSDDISYPTLLYKMLNNLNTGLNFKVFNDGIPGATTLTLLTRLENNLSKYNPDMVISMIGTNDTGMTIPYKDGWFSRIILSLYKLKILKVFVQAPLKYLKYSKGSNVFEKDKNSVDQYYCDKYGHYTIEIDPAVFLNKRGFPINDSHLKKSINHFNNGRIIDAINEVELSLKKQPDSLSTRLYLAEVYFQLSDYDKSIKIYQDVLSNKKDDAVIFIRLAKCYEMKKNFSDAEKIYMELLEKWPDDYNVNIALLSILLTKDTFYHNLNYSMAQKNELHNQIIKLCEISIALKPDNLLGYFQFGKYYYSHKEYLKALEYFRKAYQLENKKNYSGYFDINVQPASYLSECYVDLKQFEKSLEVFLPLAEQFDNPAIFRYLADIFIRMGNI